MEIKTNCIFLIDDDEISNTINTLTLQQSPYCHKILTFTDSDQIYNHLNSNNKSSDLPQVRFIDYNMPFDSAEEITKRIKEISSNIKTIILTAYLNNHQTNTVLGNIYVDDLIFKPLTDEKVAESFKKMNII